MIEFKTGSVSAAFNLVELQKSLEKAILLVPEDNLSKNAITADMEAGVDLIESLISVGFKTADLDDQLPIFAQLEDLLIS